MRNKALHVDSFFWIGNKPCTMPLIPEIHPFKNSNRLLLKPISAPPISALMGVKFCMTILGVAKEEGILIKSLNLKMSQLPGSKFFEAVRQFFLC